jgi:hypothetical protein
MRARDGSRDSDVASAAKGETRTRRYLAEVVAITSQPPRDSERSQDGADLDAFGVIDGLSLTNRFLESLFEQPGQFPTELKRSHLGCHCPVSNGQ